MISAEAEVGWYGTPATANSTKRANASVHGRDVRIAEAWASYRDDGGRRMRGLRQTVRELERELAEDSRVGDALSETRERFRTVADFTYDRESWIGRTASTSMFRPCESRLLDTAPTTSTGIPGLWRSSRTLRIARSGGRTGRPGRKGFRAIPPIRREKSNFTYVPLGLPRTTFDPPTDHVVQSSWRAKTALSRHGHSVPLSISS